VRIFAERWLEEIVAKVRRDPEPVRRLLEREVYPWIGGTRVAYVRAEDLRRLVFRKRDAGREAAAGAMRQTLKRLFDYAVTCELVEANPMLATPMKFVAKRHPRRRTLSAAELRVFFERTHDSRLGVVHGCVLRLILLTLCRKSELRLARWDQIDFERGIWEVPAELSKTGLPHIVYLSRQAAAELGQLKAFAARSQCVVPMRNGITEPVSASALNKAMTRVRWGMPKFTPHDLRRTGATILNEQGYDADVIEKALNHAVRGVRGIYNRAQYAEQRKAMLQEWADWLDGVAGTAPVEKAA
jgi:integrase